MKRPAIVLALVTLIGSLSLAQESSEREPGTREARRTEQRPAEQERRDYNTKTESVPSNIVASLFNFTQREYFQKTSDDAANVPLVKLGSVE